ncbi:hypothetical protein ISP15_00060 [Dyella jejuensis]|uniref:Uncharacterized protein n=1 Tax=Dyella jejuensis TaxID=1432009 RepID=A0ABW8JC96_9GAMM
MAASLIKKRHIHCRLLFGDYLRSKIEMKRLLTEQERLPLIAKLHTFSLFAHGVACIFFLHRQLSMNGLFVGPWREQERRGDSARFALAEPGGFAGITMLGLEPSRAS